MAEAPAGNSPVVRVTAPLPVSPLRATLSADMLIPTIQSPGRRASVAVMARRRRSLHSSAAAAAAAASASAATGGPTAAPAPARLLTAPRGSAFRRRLASSNAELQEVLLQQSDRKLRMFSRKAVQLLQAAAPTARTTGEELLQVALSLTSSVGASLFSINPMTQCLDSLRLVAHLGPSPPSLKASVLSTNASMTDLHAWAASQERTRSAEPGVDGRDGSTSAPKKVSASSLPALIIETREPCLLADASQHESFDPSLTPPGAVLLVPCIHPQSDAVSGVLQITHPSRKTFDEHDLFLAAYFARHACASWMAVKSGARVASKSTWAILEVLKAIASLSSLTEIMDKIREITKAALDADRVTFFLVDHHASELRFRVDDRSFAMPIGQGIAGHVAATGKSINAKDVQNDPRFTTRVDQLTGYKTESILCVPVPDKSDPRPIAVIQALNKFGGPFTVEDAQLLTAVAYELSNVLKSKTEESSFKLVLASHSEASEQHLRAMLLQYTDEPEHILPVDVRTTPKWSSGRRLSVFAQPVVKDWAFDPFAHAPGKLVDAAIEIFDEFDLFSRFSIDRTKLLRFVHRIAELYNDNPYHNWAHAFSVFHCTVMILSTTEATQYLEPMDIFSLLIATICHDVDHPGTNNAYLVATRSKLALLYNDISVLENHHASLSFELINSSDELNFLADLSPAEYSEVRRRVILCILATDMSHHASLVSRISKHGPVFDKSQSEDRDLLMQIIIHSADLCNPTMPTDSCTVWAKRIFDEMHQQSVLEKEQGLPVAPHMQDTSETALAKLNVNFITFVVMPLWTNVVQILPELKVCLERMEANLARWRDLAGIAPPTPNVPHANFDDLTVSSQVSESSSGRQGRAGRRRRASSSKRKKK